MIYVDDMMFPRGEKSICSLFSDVSVEELHYFAERLSMPLPEYDPTGRFPRYEVDSVQRRDAILLGAKLVHFGSEAWGDAVKRARELKHASV